MPEPPGGPEPLPESPQKKKAGLGTAIWILVLIAIAIGDAADGCGESTSVGGSAQVPVRTGDSP
jgi:hypothetical protein